MANGFATQTAGAAYHPPSAIPILLGFVALLTGRFTLDRAGLSVPVLNDPRTVIFWLLGVAIAFECSRARLALNEQRPVLLLPALLLLGYQAVSITWAPDGARAVKSLFDIAALAALCIAYWILARWDRDRVVRVTLALFLVLATVYSLGAAWQHWQDSAQRWVAFGTGPNVFVRVMVLGAFAAGYFYWRSGHRAIWLVPILAFTAGAVLSGSRGGMLAATAVLVFLVIPRVLRSGVPRLVALGAGAVPLAALTWFVAGEQISAVLTQRIVRLTFEERYTSGRDLIYGKAFALFVDRPVTGAGLDGFYAVGYIPLGVEYPHNLPLSVAAEGGVIGLALLAAAMYALCRGFLTVPSGERSLESRVAFYCGVFVGLASLFSGDYYDARLMWVFLILAATCPQRRQTVSTKAERHNMTTRDTRALANL